MVIHVHRIFTLPIVQSLELSIMRQAIIYRKQVQLMIHEMTLIVKHLDRRWQTNIKCEACGDFQ